MICRLINLDLRLNLVSVKFLLSIFCLMALTLAPYTNVWAAGCECPGEQFEKSVISPVGCCSVSVAPCCLQSSDQGHQVSIIGLSADSRLQVSVADAYTVLPNFETRPVIRWIQQVAYHSQAPPLTTASRLSIQQCWLI